MFRDAKHVLTLIITLSAAVMDTLDSNMFGMSSVTLALFPGLARRAGKRPWFQPFAHALAYY